MSDQDSSEVLNEKSGLYEEPNGHKLKETLIRSLTELSRPLLGGNVLPCWILLMMGFSYCFWPEREKL